MPERRVVVPRCPAKLNGDECIHDEGHHPATPHEFSPCIAHDPTCPCNDGDVCNYVDLEGSPAMALPAAEQMQDLVDAVAAYSRGDDHSIEKIIQAAMKAQEALSLKSAAPVPAPKKAGDPCPNCSRPLRPGGSKDRPTAYCDDCSLERDGRQTCWDVPPDTPARKVYTLNGMSERFVPSIRIGDTERTVGIKYVEALEDELRRHERELTEAHQRCVDNVSGEARLVRGARVAYLASRNALRWSLEAFDLKWARCAYCDKPVEGEPHDGTDHWHVECARKRNG